MGIFDIFSAGPGQQAAQDQITALNQAKQDMSAQYGQANQALNTNYAAALQPFTQQYGYGQRWWHLHERLARIVQRGHRPQYRPV